MQIGRIKKTVKKKRPETPLKEIVLFEKKVLPFHLNTLKSTVQVNKVGVNKLGYKNVNQNEILLT